MPLLRIQTSTDVLKKDDFLNCLSSSLSSLTGKPESYVMIILEDNKLIVFAGDSSPSAFVEVKSIGAINPKLMSKDISKLIEEKLNIPSSRVYINFEDISPKCWGYNSSTFG